MQFKKNKNGYIALISIMIIGAIVLSLVLAITVVSLNQKFSLIGYNQSLRSYYLADACASYALIKLQNDPGYTGNETVELDENFCYIEPISGEGNNDRIIITGSQVGDYERKVEVKINQIKPETIIDTWQELTAF